MTDSELKVNDKRMFTADGELREQFEHLGEQEADDSGTTASPSEEPAAATDVGQEQPTESENEPAPSRPDAEPPSGFAEDVGFSSLVGLLAEHASVYLGERALPDGESLLDLRAAQAHIDLLDVLSRKTKGNLSEQESSLLADVLYQLRLVYVEKRRRES